MASVLQSDHGIGWSWSTSCLPRDSVDKRPRDTKLPGCGREVAVMGLKRVENSTPLKQSHLVYQGASLELMVEAQREASKVPCDQLGVFAICCAHRAVVAMTLDVDEADR